MISLAGFIAQTQLAESDGAFVSAGPDFDYARDITGRLAMSDGEAEAHFEYLMERTSNLLARRSTRALVEGLASQLMLERTMTGRRCREAISDAWAKVLPDATRECPSCRRDKNVTCNPLQPTVEPEPRL